MFAWIWMRRNSKPAISNKVFKSKFIATPNQLALKRSSVTGEFAFIFSLVSCHLSKQTQIQRKPNHLSKPFSVTTQSSFSKITSPAHFSQVITVQDTEVPAKTKIGVYEFIQPLVQNGIAVVNYSKCIWKCMCVWKIQETVTPSDIIYGPIYSYLKQKTWETKITMTKLKTEWLLKYEIGNCKAKSTVEDWLTGKH